jgi:hypothetical protein
MTMRFYNRTHRFYCGVDLHARTLPRRHPLAIAKPGRREVRSSTAVTFSPGKLVAFQGRGSVVT